MARWRCQQCGRCRGVKRKRKTRGRSLSRSLLARRKPCRLPRHRHPPPPVPRVKREDRDTSRCHCRHRDPAFQGARRLQGRGGEEEEGAQGASTASGPAGKNQVKAKQMPVSEATAATNVSFEDHQRQVDVGASEEDADAQGGHGASHQNAKACKGSGCLRRRLLVCRARQSAQDGQRGGCSCCGCVSSKGKDKSDRGPVHAIKAKFKQREGGGGGHR